jgi:hypothetical protein
MTGDYLHPLDFNKIWFDYILRYHIFSFTCKVTNIYLKNQVWF